MIETENAGDVYQDLLYPAGVHPDQARVRRRLEHQVDVLSNEAAQHLVGFEHELIQVNKLRLHGLAAGEG
ncbi:MAG: hypothetical protein QGH97_10760 [Dehalococcoidia bacterium]|nr:hypothetical protein [Dehalococcoidia bacterium]MDP7084830.1 hypothetical protein [Dehalococcoidia bacterium]MDP7199689.1 hypothetical protein [Dehalococcoidia bacterium]MDP7511370.1 hypothetical protein [Dehalococcoidia bacterium]HJN87324.1 hypothetical protein [Dehalococcoidia bacterium]